MKFLNTIFIATLLVIFCFKFNSNSANAYSYGQSKTFECYNALKLDGSLAMRRCTTTGCADTRKASQGSDKGKCKYGSNHN